ncbi:MAG: MBL fold metallo-hydrolase [Bacteroidia bacterium]|nr:MBL fold metallo-hydrolase [Bacteroidia bacterium]
MQIQFLGATRTVTGSKHLLTTAEGKKVLLDCGFFQGKGSETDGLNRHFGFDPASIDYLILSHAHIDHSGNIPNLVKQGFRGPIICTTATADLCRIMLSDSAHIQENDVKFINKRRMKRGEEPLKPIYNIKDVEKCLPLFVRVPYETDYQVFEGFSVRFTDSGHILGAAAVNIQYTENGQKRTLCYTGDIGRYNGSILKSPQPFPQAETLICESTYGDRLHTDNDMSEQQLFEVVYNTCVVKKGKLIIPAFSLGRTQEIVFALDKMEHKKMLPHINVYVDSPLSINATNIMRAHPECFNEDILAYMKKDPNPFGFGNLIYIQDAKDSKMLNELPEPCIIISASGMVEAGRVKHHVANNISNPKNTILMVGYAEPNSIGGKIRSGAKTIKVFGEMHEVKADVVIIDSYSAHGDYKEMIQYLSCLDKKQVKHLFLVHGEYDTQLNFKEKLIDEGYRHIQIPAQGDIVEI